MQSDNAGVSMVTLQAALCEKDAEILQLKEELKAATSTKDNVVTQVCIQKQSYIKKYLKCVKLKKKYPELCVQVVFCHQQFVK